MKPTYAVAALVASLCFTATVFAQPSLSTALDTVQQSGNLRCVPP